VCVLNTAFTAAVLMIRLTNAMINMHVHEHSLSLVYFLVFSRSIICCYL